MTCTRSFRSIANPGLRRATGHPATDARATGDRATGDRATGDCATGARTSGSRTTGSPRAAAILRAAFCLSAVLLLGSGTAEAVDSDLEALIAKTGTEDTSAIERAREWAASTKEGADPAAYLESVRKEAFAEPQNVDVVRHYIQVAKSQDKTGQLVRELESYAKENPKRPEAHYYLGLAVQPDDAAAYFEKSIELDPRFYPGLVGVASAELGSPTPDLVRAKKHLLEAARLDPSEPLAFVVLEQLYRQTGDTDSQVLAMAKAVEADPWDARLKQTLLRHLQSQAQGIQQTGGNVEEWIGNTTSLLVRLAKVGSGQPELAVAAARIFGATGNRAAILETLSLAADLGFADPRGLTFDRTLGAAINNNPAAEPILAKMEKNREAGADQLKAKAMEELISVATPEVTSIPLMGGGTLDLSAKKGKVIILDFWATWCGPCRRALPVVQELHEKKLEDVEIYCVNVFERDGGKQIESFWETGGYPMPVALGTDDWASAFGVSSIPTLFLIGPDGQVRYRHQGFSPYLAEELTWISQGLLNQN